MTRPVVEQLAPLEARLAAASPDIRRVVALQVDREVDRQRRRRRQALPDSHVQAIRLRVLLGWDLRSVENPTPPNERGERAE